jgi:hypothetical protein
MRSSAPFLKFQYLLYSLRLSIRCLCLLPCLHTPPIFPSKMCFRQQYLCKMWPIQLAFPCLIVCRCSFPPCLYIIFVHFSCGQPNWSFPSYSVTTFKKVHNISDLFAKVSKFLHHTKLCSTCRIPLVSSLHLSTSRTCHNTNIILVRYQIFTYSVLSESTYTDLSSYT